ncbi:metal-dependent hydrolase family protein [Kamptonema formosum]|uniref:metal-dependent hydrolase family protein n=1 Tax=Kamptonema formosum TaxID=331992 RepID=UPI000349ACC3|nr:amidohydrolase family protein [Oscillatoria sp. PCC 10802]
MANATNQTYVIVAEQYWDGLAENLLGPSEIRVENGQITAVAPKVDRTNAQIIELKGHSVTPGFIDCHVHVTFCEGDPNIPENPYQATTPLMTLYSLGALKKLLMNGFTTIREVGCPNPEFITVDIKRAIAKGWIIGPRMFVCPHLISAQGGHGDFTSLVAFQFSPEKFEVADGTAEIIRMVREEIRSGADWIKFCATGGFSSPTDDPSQTTYSQEEMNVLVSTAKDFGIYACPHAYGGEGIKRAVKAGVRSIEHGNLATADTLQLMEQQGVYIVPTQYTVLEKARNVNNDAYWQHRSPWQHAKYQKYASQLIECAQNLAKSNVKIAFGTDAGTFPHQDNWKEFPAMVQNGITPSRALKAATSAAAELLMQPNIGVLAPGKIADIVAMPGNPFEDINVTGQVDFVMKEGVIYKHPSEE